MQESKGLGGNTAEGGKAGRTFQISGARERETEVEVAGRGRTSREGNAANGATRFAVEGATPARRAQIPTVSSGSAHFTISSYGGLGGGPSGSLDGSQGGSSLAGGLGVGRDGSLVIDGSYFQTSSEALALLSLARRVHVGNEQQGWRGAEEGGGGGGVGDLSVSAAVSEKEDPQSGRRRRRTMHPDSDSESGSGSGKSSPISALSGEHDGSEAETDKNKLDSGTEVETGSQSRSESEEEEEEEEDDHGSKQRHSSANVELVAMRRSGALRTSHFCSSQRTVAEEEEEQEVDGAKISVSGIMTRSFGDSSSDQSDASSGLTDTSNNLSPILEDTEEEEEERSSSPSEDEEEEEGHLENESADRSAEEA